MYSWFTHYKWWFSIVFGLFYERNAAPHLDSQGVGRAHTGHHTQPGARRGAQRGDLAVGKPWENHGKTIGKLWFNESLWWFNGI